MTGGFFETNLGAGLGLRTDHYDHVLRHRPQVPWFEVNTENFIGIEGHSEGKPILVLERVRENYPIVCHGVSMSIGSADPVDLRYLQKLKDLFERIEPLWVSDHLCWTGVDGEHLHDLLPVPYTKEALSHVVAKIEQVQEFLQRPILIENVSAYLSYKDSEMNEWEFLSEVAVRSGCGILLDVNNVYVSATNLGFDPLDYIRGIPKDRVGQFHLAGHSVQDGFLFDTHDHPVPDPVWDLFKKAVSITGPVPSLIEWDAKLPEFETLEAEAKKAQTILDQAEKQERRHLEIVSL